MLVLCVGWLVGWWMLLILLDKVKVRHRAQNDFAVLQVRVKTMQVSVTREIRISRRPINLHNANYFSS